MFKLLFKGVLSLKSTSTSVVQSESTFGPSTAFRHGPKRVRFCFSQKRTRKMASVLLMMSFCRKGTNSKKRITPNRLSLGPCVTSTPLDSSVLASKVIDHLFYCPAMGAIEGMQASCSSHPSRTTCAIEVGARSALKATDPGQAVPLRKARLVLLGLTDPDLGEMSTAAPTLSRRGRCVLNLSASDGQCRS